MHSHTLDSFLGCASGMLYHYCMYLWLSEQDTCRALCTHSTHRAWAEAEVNILCYGMYQPEQARHIGKPPISNRYMLQKATNSLPLAKAQLELHSLTCPCSFFQTARTAQPSTSFLLTATPAIKIGNVFSCDVDLHLSFSFPSCPEVS